MSADAKAGSQHGLVRQWRESALSYEREASNHAAIYGRGNDIYLGHLVRAETLRQAAAELESALPNTQAADGPQLAARPGSADELELTHMSIYWIHYPASSLGSFYRCETHRGFTGPEDAMILVVTIFKEDNTWLVCLEDTLNSDEFQAVHHKLQEILANDLRPY